MIDRVATALVVASAALLLSSSEAPAEDEVRNQATPVNYIIYYDDQCRAENAAGRAFTDPLVVYPRDSITFINRSEDQNMVVVFDTEEALDHPGMTIPPGKRRRIHVPPRHESEHTTTTRLEGCVSEGGVAGPTVVVGECP